MLSRSPDTLDRLQRSSTEDARGQSGPHRKLSGESLRTSASARVLVVEPVPVLRTIITRAFADRGHSVTAVATLEDMRRLLPSFDPHVIVCELTLPDGSGDNACRRLKVSGNKLRPVVLMSGVPENELMRRAMQAGADRFHCKSRGLSELIDVNRRDRRRDRVLRAQRSGASRQGVGPDGLCPAGAGSRQRTE